MKVIEDVFDFNVWENNVAFIRGSSLFSKSLFINKILVHDSNVSTFFFNSTYLIFSTWEPSTYFFEIEKAAINFKLNGYSCSTEFFDDYVFISKENIGKYETSMMNLATHEKINIGNNFVGNIISNLRVITELNSLEVFTIPGDKLWSHSLFDSKYDWYTKSNYENAPDELNKGEILRIIGEYAGTLWIVLNSGLLLGLNNETGELVHELMFPNNYPNEGQPFNRAINTQLDKEKGVLFGLRNNYYWEIDLNHPETGYYLYDVAESCESWHISADMPVREWSWVGDRIYFGEIYDSPHNPNLNNVGIFDRERKEVTYAMRMGDGGKHDVTPNIQKIQFESGRLYVLDGRKVLHILEEDIAT